MRRKGFVSRLFNNVHTAGDEGDFDAAAVVVTETQEIATTTTTTTTKAPRPAAAASKHRAPGKASAGGKRHRRGGKARRRSVIRLVKRLGAAVKRGEVGDVELEALKRFLEGRASYVSTSAKRRDCVAIRLSGGRRRKKPQN